MSVIRIVADLATADVQGMAAFYSDLFGLNVLMDQGWIVTLGSSDLGPVQLSIASTGGGGAPVPDLTIQVEDVDDIHAHAQELGLTLSYPLTDEDWGVRRFFVNDPMGRVINVMSHR